MSTEDLQRRVSKLEENSAETREDIATIKTYITNHLPHTLADVRAGIDNLNQRLMPFETKATKIQGVSEFLTVLLKGIAAVAGVTWTIFQIIQFVKGM